MDLSFIKESVSDNASDWLQAIGIDINPDARPYQNATHTLILCLILTTGQIFSNVRDSHYLDPRQAKHQDNEKNLQMKKNHTKPLLEDQNQQLMVNESAQPGKAPKTQNKNNMLSKTSRLLQKYQAFVSLWGFRICSILIAYSYNGYPGFVVLTQVLLSFIVTTELFVWYTVSFYMYYFIGTFVLEYFFNVQKLFFSCKFIIDNKVKICGQDFEKGFYQKSKTAPIWPIEVSIFIINIICMCVMFRTKNTLKTSRENFKLEVLRKLKDSNFLWQLCFYLLKYFHLIALPSIFLFSITGINLYFIGLLYFSLRYISSLKAYRKCGSTLLIFTAFFIWNKYLWEYARKNYITLDQNMVEVTSQNKWWVKFLDMLTFTEVVIKSTNEKDPTKETNEVINQYVPLEVQIPVNQWLILLIMFLLFTINRLFKSKQKQKKIQDNTQTQDQNANREQTDSPQNINEKDDSEDQAKITEAEVAANLSRKFPKTSKYGVRIRMILSEFIIYAILISQTLILVFQEPNALYWVFLILSLNLQYSVINSTEQRIDNQKTKALVLKNYAAIVLILQIGYKLINDKKFLKQYGWDAALNEYIVVIIDYMPVFGFSKPSDKDVNIINLFLSPIIFYITTSILKDNFSQKMSQVPEKQIQQLKNKNNLIRSNESENDYQNQEAFLKFEEEVNRVKFTVVYQIYQRMNQWYIIDKIASHFHILTVGYAFYLCSNWQVSLIMYIQFIFAVYLCIRLALNLQKTSNNLRQEYLKQNNKNENFELFENRNNIPSTEFDKEFITIDEAHKYSKAYMKVQNQEQLKVRQNIWRWQYAFLIFAMIVMYPTPLMNKLSMIEQERFNQTTNLVENMYLNANLTTNEGNLKFSSIKDDSVWWMFWVGIYVDPADSSSFASHYPLYIILTLFVIEKFCQKWLHNRNGCTLEQIAEFKKLDETIRIIENIKKIKEQSKIKESDQNQQDRKINLNQPIENSFQLKFLEEKFQEIQTEQFNQQIRNLYLKKGLNEENKSQSIQDQNPMILYVSFYDSYNLCKDIEEKMNHQSEEQKLKRIRKDIILEIKRKYTIQYREALKFIIELFILQLVLFSCAQKANIFGLLYLGLLIMYLIIENKQKGILIIAQAIGYSMIIEYLFTLLNLNYANTPMPFPSPHLYYPCQQDSQNSADCTNLQNSTLTMPIFINVELLRQNLPLAMYFGVDILRFQLNDIWFDYINLALITIYFFSFGNPLYNLKQIKISFSKTRSLEKKLKSFAKIEDDKIKIKQQIFQQTVKNFQKERVEIKQEENNEKEVVTYIRDDSQAFLGSTFYLQKLKNKAFIYNFTRKMKIFSFIGLQLVGAIFIFIIAALSRSFMSLGYLALCIVLFWNMKDFFYQDKLQQRNRKWINPTIIKKFLIIYSFFDITCQIIYQMPQFGAIHETDGKVPNVPDNSTSYLPMSRYLGFDKIYQVNHSIKSIEDLIKQYAKQEQDKLDPYFNSAKAPSPLAHIDIQSLYYFILKSMNLFFIFLMIQIYKSEGYKKFLRSDLRTYLVMANNYKAYIQTYFYNNTKLEKMITIQQKKKQMYDTVQDVKIQVKKWKNSQRALIDGSYLPPNLDNQDNERQSQNIPKTKDNKKPQIGNETQKTSDEVDNHKKKLHIDIKKEDLEREKKQILIDLNLEFSMRKLAQLNQKDYYYLRKRNSYKKIKNELPLLAKWYLSINKRFVNMALFIQTINDATRIKLEAEKGIKRTSCDLKQTMKKEINIFISKQIQEEAKKREENVIEADIKKNRKIIDINDLKETKEFVKFSRIIISFLGVIPKALISKMAAIAYIFMIISMIQNAGLISILYPFAVFGYALMEEGRPSKSFWNFNDYRIGLIRVEGIIEMFQYIFPEFIILVAVWTQQFYEILLGVHETREIELENISEARERFLKQFSDNDEDKIEKSNQQKKKEAALNEKKKVETWQNELKNVKKELNEIKIGKINIFDEKLVKIRSREDYEVTKHIKIGDRQEIHNYIHDNQKQNLSLIPDKEALKKKAKDIRKKKLTNVGKFLKFIKKQQYFSRLFPLVKEEKPGRDLYAKTTFILFVICFYMINYYSNLDARGTQILENTNQYSYHMTILVFINVGTLIAERYISRTNVRKHNRAKNAAKVLDRQRNQNSNSTNGKTNKSNKSHKSHKKSESIIKTFNPKNEQDQFSQLEQYTKLEPTYITIQQFLKWGLQIVLLIYYHYIIFWVFPIQSNQAIYGQSTCKKDSNSFSTYGCFDFNKNYYLLIFYLLYCSYFMQSALQIRYGFSDWKEPSSLTRRPTSLSQNLNLIYYNLPFLVELKTVLDWYFTKTSLDIFQWLELSEINNQLYNAQVSNSSYYDKNRKLGQKATSFEKKLCGWFCMGLMLFFLVGPFAFFSNMRFVATYNPIKDISLNFGLQINQLQMDQKNTYEFQLYSTEKALNIKEMTQDQFNLLNYQNQPETKFFEPGQVQVIQMQPASEKIWQASPEYKDLFTKLIKNASDPKLNQNIQIDAILGFTFQRDLPATAKTITGSRTVSINLAKDYKVFQELSKIDQCNTNTQTKYYEFKLKYFLPLRIRAGQGETVKPLSVQNITNQATKVDKDQYQLKLDYRTVNVQYYCKGFWALTEQIDENERDPIINKNKLHGVTLQIFSDMISTGFWSEASILAFYLGTVMTVGALFRTLVMYKIDRCFILDARNPAKIRAVITAIYRQRHEENLKKEEELFFLLFEILRNPQLFAYLTETSLKGTEMNPEEYPDNEMKKRKTQVKHDIGDHDDCDHKEESDRYHDHGKKGEKGPLLQNNQQIN